MKLKALLFLFVVLFIGNSYGQVVYDTLTAEKVGPGVTHYYLRNYTVPWAISVMEVELANPYLSIETIKGDDRLTGLEKVTSMSSRNSSEGHLVIGATNGDLWSGGPIGQQISNGEIVKGYGYHSTMYFSEDKKVFLSKLTINGLVVTKDTAAALAGTNIDRGSNALVLYNRFMGSSTTTNVYGSEAVLTPITDWIVNDTVKLVVGDITTGVGDAAIPNGKVILSGNGTSENFIVSKLHAGDTVKIIYGLDSGIKERINQLMGGYPQIVKNGENYAIEGHNDEGSPSGLTREPRTAIGFSQDSSKLYLFVVDGRQATLSAGMTIEELADFMIQSGVYTGMNMDGGGSSTMVIRDAFVNSPSDGPGTERNVISSIQVVSSAPSSGQFAHIEVNPKSIRIFKGESVQYSAKGRDEYNNPYAIESANVTYSISPELGQIASSGLFTAGEKADTGYIIVSYNGQKDSARVVIKSINSLILNPVSVVTDTVKTVSFSAKAYDFDGIFHAMPANEYTWSTSDDNIGIVDSMGVFTGKSEGTVQVIVSYEGFADTADVKVEIGKGNVLVKSFDSLEGLQASGENLDSVSISIENIGGGNKLKVYYEYTGDPQKVNYVSVVTDLPLYGIPDSLNITAQASNTKNNHMHYILSDDNGELFQLNTKQYISKMDEFVKLPSMLKDVSAKTAGAVFYYPARIKQINIKLADDRILGNKYTGYLYIGDMYAIYPESAIGIEDGLENTPTSYSLSQNYPNPFNPTTNIRFAMEKEGYVSLRVYDILGREISVILNGQMKGGQHNVIWNASNFPSGIYIYQLNVDGKKLTKKMTLLK